MDVREEKEGLEEEPRRLTPEEFEYFKKLLLEKREKILREVKETFRKQEEGDTPVPGDDVDQATTEYDKAFEMRLRDREKRLLRKIDHALERIENGDYDLCESCGAPIGKKRLLARPEATLCIACKEDQERQERMFRKKSRARLNIEL